MIIPFQRVWSFPNADTFDIQDIAYFVKKYLIKSELSVDPFARNKRWATYTNDLNPETEAEYHLPAHEFLKLLQDKGVQADLVLFDPPYSVTQLKECYAGIGMEFTEKDAQSLGYKTERDLIDGILRPGGIVLSFGWSSTCMSEVKGYEIIDLLLVSHGRRQHDTICLAERKAIAEPRLFGCSPTDL